MAVNNHPCKIQTSLLIACLILLTNNIFSSTNGFTTDLIQRDSPFSPAYSPAASAGGFGRLRRAVRRSLNRANHYKSSLTSRGVSLESNPIQSRIIPSEGEYLMNVSIGTPAVPLLGIADTGSDLIWTQCRPCRQCFKQTPRLFDPSRSATYRAVACESEPCSQLAESTCLGGAAADTCGYSYSYGDRSFTRGTLASETLTLGGVKLPKVVFGCGHDNGGTFDESGSGLVGLGGGPLSLVSQLGGAAKFSYCLVPLSAESFVTSKITFGDGAAVAGAATPLVAKDPNTFYYVTLKGISVGEKRLVYDEPLSASAEESRVSANSGNIIIDSGTTLTFLPAGFHDELAAAVEEEVGGGVERVSDPSGVMSLCFRDESGGAGFAAPTVTAHFDGADVVLQPMNTFARVEDDVVCFTMIASEDVAIFGNLAQMNFLVGYDLEQGTVSFKPTDCTTITI